MSRWIVILLGAGAAGCGFDASSFCKAQESCRGGNAADTQACADVQSYQHDHAQDLGCASEFSDNFDCVSAHSTCHQTMGPPCTSAAGCVPFGGGTCTQGRCVFGEYGIDTSNNQKNPCQAQESALQSCVSQ
jgi:hypothetical protein